jgi:hypothetical protein
MTLEELREKTQVRFLDHGEVIRHLRQAVREAKAKYPEIVKVFLFGSFARGDWTADSDADLIVVVGKELSGFSSRSPYCIFAVGMATDSLVYSTREFEKMSRDPTSFVAQNLPSAIEL